MKIFAAHDGGSGCCYYRITVPLTELGRHTGYEVTFRDAGDLNGPQKPLSLADLEGYDIILAQRFNKHSGMGVWRQARGPFSRLVYELDDDVFNVGPENWQAYRMYGREDVRDAVSHYAGVSDLITVTTPHLAEVMARETGNPNVAVLPNHIPLWVTQTERTRRERPAIGWMGGASHGADVGLIVKPLRQFTRRFPGWDFRLAGTDYRPTFKLGDRAVFSKWVPVNDDPHGYFATMDFDIGLAPLLDNEFSRSKSFVKALEYNALGIPVIASDTEPYRGYIRDGINGFLVRHEHEWLARMSELAADEGLRERIGRQARECAEEYTIERGWGRWAMAYESMFTPIRATMA